MSHQLVHQPEGRQTLIAELTTKEGDSLGFGKRCLTTPSISDNRVDRLKSGSLASCPSVRVLPILCQSALDYELTMSSTIICQHPQLASTFRLDLLGQSCEAQSTGSATMMTYQVCPISRFLGRNGRIQVNSKGSIVSGWIHFKSLFKVCRSR